MRSAVSSQYTRKDSLFLRQQRCWLTLANFGLICFPVAYEFSCFVLGKMCFWNVSGLVFKTLDPLGCSIVSSHHCAEVGASDSERRHWALTYGNKIQNFVFANYWSFDGRFLFKHLSSPKPKWILQLYFEVAEHVFCDFFPEDLGWRGHEFSTGGVRLLSVWTCIKCFLFASQQCFCLSNVKNVSWYHLGGGGGMPYLDLFMRLASRSRNEKVSLISRSSRE